MEGPVCGDDRFGAVVQVIGPVDVESSERPIDVRGRKGDLLHFKVFGDEIAELRSGLGKSLRYNFKPFSGNLSADQLRALKATQTSRPLSVAANGAMDRFIRKFDPSAISQMHYAYLMNLFDGLSAWRFSGERHAKILEHFELYEDRIRRGRATLDPADVVAVEFQKFAEESAKNVEKRLKGSADRTRDLILPPISKVSGLPRFSNSAKGVDPRAAAPSDASNQNKQAMIEAIRKSLLALTSAHSQSRRLFDDVLEMVLESQEYSDDMSIVNEGIVRYFSRTVAEDVVLASDAMDFYSRLYLLDRSSDLQVASRFDANLFDSGSAVNIWPYALESTEGDPVRAIRVLSIFGHDDQAQTLLLSGSVHGSWSTFLNTFVPA